MKNLTPLKNLASWAFGKAKGLRGRIFASCLLGILRVAASLGFVWVSKLIIDTATAHVHDTHRIVVLAVILISLMVSEMLFSLSVSYLNNQTEARMRNRLRDTLYKHILYSYRADTSRSHSGDLLNRLTEDVRMVSDVVCNTFQATIVMIIQLLAAFIFLFAMAPMLSLCILCILPIFLVLSKTYIFKMRTITSEIRQDESKIYSNMQEGIQHQTVVQTLECEGYMRDKLGVLQQDVYAVTMRRTRFSTFSRAMVRLGFMAGYLTAFLWCVWHLHLGAITFGTMTAFLQLVARMQNPMSSLTGTVPSFVHASASVDRLMEIEALPLEDKSSMNLLQTPVGIRLQDITFKYAQGEREIFTDFSYDFAPGSKTVVMGETGVGKSTLVKLLLALIYPQKGKISLYNTTETAEVSPSTRCNMVYVPQGNSLIDGTIRDNLLLGDPEATETELRTALHTAVADFIYELPRGLDTHCGELGSGLSEGQAQRIAIARALLRNGSILLLDEFNSALDETTASTLISRINQTHPASTIIFISHRPEVAKYCNNILRIEE